jgi:hypothetical protein
MKVMRIGSSLINLTNFVSIDGHSCNDGVVLTIKHGHSVKEYLVPNEIDPELVVCVVLDCLNQYANFDLLYKLKARRAMIEYDD